MGRYEAPLWGWHTEQLIRASDKQAEGKQTPLSQQQQSERRPPDPAVWISRFWTLFWGWENSHVLCWLHTKENIAHNEGKSEAKAAHVTIFNCFISWLSSNLQIGEWYTKNSFASSSASGLTSSSIPCSDEGYLLLLNCSCDHILPTAEFKGRKKFSTLIELRDLEILGMCCLEMNR